MPWRRPAERSELVHIVVTSYQKRKYPRKYYVFVIDVTWNNSDRYEIYRRYSEFFSFQTTLKGMFPAAAGRRNEERTIPQLPKRIFVGRSHVAKVAEARLEQINRYCQTLISLDPKISESAHVIGFFSPRIGDKSMPKLHLHRPASLHPMKIPAGSLFEEYCALAEFHAEDESQVSFKSGQMILVLNKDNSGWWMCQVDDKAGWAPPSYLKKVDKGESTEGESDSDDDYLGLPGFVDPDKEDADQGSTSEGKDPTSNGGSLRGKTFNVPEIEFHEYKAIDSYEAQGDGQVSFEEGDIIQVLDKIEDGWWFVVKGQEEGWVPCSYLEPLQGGPEEDDTISSLDIEKYLTVETYVAEEEDELSFPNGVTVDVLQKSLDGWWLVKHGGKAALAPATFLVKKESSSENSPPLTRKSSSTNATEPQEGGEGVNVKTLPQEEGVNTTTRSYRQPPRKESVRMRVSKRKTRLLHNKTSALATNGLRTPPPSIREESPSPTPSQARKMSDGRPTQLSTSPVGHARVARKLSEQPSPTQTRVQGKRKISLDSALAGAPKIAANGLLVYQKKSSPETAQSPVSTVDSDTDDHDYFNIDPQAYLREKRQRQLQQQQQQQQQQQRKQKQGGQGAASPTTSDSEMDVSGSTQDSSHSAAAAQNRVKNWERRMSSDSEDSTTSSPVTTRRPIAAPRINKPDLKTKPKSTGNPQMPPRPRQGQISRARNKITQKEEEPQPPQLQEVRQPYRPQRPRGTEIRRARETKSPMPPSRSPSHTPTPPPSTPIITPTPDQREEPQLQQQRVEWQPHKPQRPQETEIRRARGGKSPSHTPTPPPSTPIITATPNQGEEREEPPQPPQQQVARQPYRPQRPRGTEIRRARETKSPVPPSLSPSHTPTPTITATPNQGEEPQPPQQKVEWQPHKSQRPQETEIRRAREGKSPSHTPTPPPSTPIITATTDHGECPVILSTGSSAFKPIPQRRSPSPAGLTAIRENSTEEADTSEGSKGVQLTQEKPPNRSPSPSVSAVTSSGASLSPPKPARRHRSHSESEMKDSVPTPSPSLSPSAAPVALLSGIAGAGGDDEGNPFNQQMAETLIKYILASQDSGLKTALRDCIMSSPEAVNALQK